MLWPWFLFSPEFSHLTALCCSTHFVVHGLSFRSLDAFVNVLADSVPVLIHERWPPILCLPFAWCQWTCAMHLLYLLARVNKIDDGSVLLFPGSCVVSCLVSDTSTEHSSGSPADSAISSLRADLLARVTLHDLVSVPNVPRPTANTPRDLFMPTRRFHCLPFALGSFFSRLA